MDDTLTDIAIAAVLLTAVAVPAVRGAVRDHRDNLAVREGRDRADRRTGVLVVFDQAYGPHEDRVRRAGAGSAASTCETRP